MTFTTGPVSSGTLLPQDLAPAFLNLLGDVEPYIIGTDWWIDMERDVARIVASGGMLDNAPEIIDRISDEINTHLPSGFYFGTSEGDGAEFGIWENDETPRCDICGTADEEADEWCGNCGCCQNHCQHFHGCNWVIVSSAEKDDDGGALFWSNDQGWVSRDDATEFTYNEHLALSLPDTGAWMYA